MKKQSKAGYTIPYIEPLTVTESLRLQAKSLRQAARQARQAADELQRQAGVVDSQADALAKKCE